MKKLLSSLSVLLPTYNDEATIELVISRADQMARSLAEKYEIIVINDGSTDKTPILLKALQKKIPKLKILTHQINQGYGVSIKELYYAGGMDWLVTLPGDNQIDPFEVVTLSKSALVADMILGKRKKRGDHFKRRLQSQTYNALLKLFFNISTSDVNTIRLMKHDIMKKVHLIMTSPFVDAELVLKAQQSGFTIIEVPIAHKARTTPGATGGKFFQTILPTIYDMIQFRLQMSK